MAARVLLELEVLAELEARVDHRADPERDRAHAQVEAAVVLGRPDPVLVARQLGVRVGQALAVGAQAARRLRRLQLAQLLLLLVLCANPKKKMRTIKEVPLPIPCI